MKSFYSYVSTYWSWHCRQARKTDEVDRLIESFTAKSKLRSARTFSEGNKLADPSQDSTEVSGEEQVPNAAKVVLDY